jgi:putative transcriptional regulator
MVKKYKSEAMAAIHETMEALHDLKTIDKKTMRHFDEMCLTPVKKLTPEEIRAIREREHISQSVLAHYMNVTTGIVSQWERGQKQPAGASLKLLTLLDKKGLAAIS